MSKNFVQGFAMAIGSLCRDHDEPTLAQSIMMANGITIDDMRKADVEDFDLQPIITKIRE